MRSASSGDSDPRRENAARLPGLAARLMLTSERRESVEGVTDDIECAFAALGTDIDREIALRVATASLPMLGLTLDRVRSEDFFSQRRGVAASPQVGPYSRALWHLLLVDALFRRDLGATTARRARRLRAPGTVQQLSSAAGTCPSDPRLDGPLRRRRRRRPRKPGRCPSAAEPGASARLLGVSLLQLAPRAADRRRRRRLGTCQSLSSQSRTPASPERAHDARPHAAGLRADRSGSASKPRRRSRGPGRCRASAATPAWFTCT